MTRKRVHYPHGEEHNARRRLEQLGRRWPTNPNVCFVLLAALLIVALMLAYR